MYVQNFAKYFKKFKICAKTGHTDAGFIGRNRNDNSLNINYSLHAHFVLPSKQCDQIGQFIELWATF